MYYKGKNMAYEYRLAFKKNKIEAYKEKYYELEIIRRKNEIDEEIEILIWILETIHTIEAVNEIKETDTLAKKIEKEIEQIGIGGPLYRSVYPVTEKLDIHTEY